MSANYKKSGFTLIELLTVLVIMAVLLGLLVPALTMVRNTARRAKQKAQFTSIGQALMAFRSDYGDYPESGARDLNFQQYCGAQKLTEALLGWDLMGFHPDSAWRVDGYDKLAPAGEWTYDPDKMRGDQSLYERVGPYLELATTNVFRLEQLFPIIDLTTWALRGDRFVICDSFGVKKVVVGKQAANAGTPILYYKANISSKTMGNADPRLNIYNYGDNLVLCSLNSLSNNQQHFLGATPALFNSEDYKVIDRKVFDSTGRLWPHRPDSYILISAGPDGLYGSPDDITNF